MVTKWHPHFETQPNWDKDMWYTCKYFKPNTPPLPIAGLHLEKYGNACILSGYLLLLVACQNDLKHLIIPKRCMLEISREKLYRNWGEVRLRV